MYLDNGKLHGARLHSVATKNCRIDTAAGRRKLDRGKVVGVVVQEEITATLANATALADNIDMAQVWHAASGEELSTAELAQRVMADQPAVLVRNAALHLAHARERAFFSCDQGQWKPVPLCQYEAVQESRKCRAERNKLEEQWQRELTAGRLPAALFQVITKFLEHDLDPNDLDVKFLRRYCKYRKLSFAELAIRYGVITDLEHLHLRACQTRIPPPRVAIPPPVNLEALELVGTGAVAIDGRGTIEVDDAFTIKHSQNAGAQVVVCVAAPALGLDEQSWAQAHERLITVYLPGHKYPMLPEATIARYSLTAPATCPCVALLCGLNDGNVDSSSEFSFQLGKVAMGTNIAFEEFGKTDLKNQQLSAEENQMLATIEQFSSLLPPRQFNKGRTRGHLISVEQGVPCIVDRQYFAAADDLVAALMMHYNTCAACFLQDHQVPYLVRKNGRLLVADCDAKNDEQPYGWFSSPLRRIIDLYNQGQLIAIIQGQQPPWDTKQLHGIIKEFDRCHQWAKLQQQQLETYWSIRWLEQHPQRVWAAVTTAVPGRVLLKDAPVIVAVADCGLPAQTEVSVELKSLDPFRLLITGQLT